MQRELFGKGALRLVFSSRQFFPSFGSHEAQNCEDGSEKKVLKKEQSAATRSSHPSGKVETSPCDEQVVIFFADRANGGDNSAWC